jgi:hypothetical protein
VLSASELTVIVASTRRASSGSTPKSRLRLTFRRTGDRPVGRRPRRPGKERFKKQPISWGADGVPQGQGD